MDSNKNGKIQMRRYRKRKENEEGAEQGRGPSYIKSVMFCPYTPGQAAETGGGGPAQAHGRQAEGG